MSCYRYMYVLSKCPIVHKIFSTIKVRTFANIVRHDFKRAVYSAGSIQQKRLYLNIQSAKSFILFYEDCQIANTK